MRWGLFRRTKSEDGQASVMIGMMMLTFFLFFAFVINTGMLVNAKINLQNAADMAAYAGAAVQARQLNHISFLNYEMRRQYKKFLFRYYVLGNMAQSTFYNPAGSHNTGLTRIWSPDNDPTHDFGVPAVCLIFNSKNNYCHLKELAPITIPGSSPLDHINETLRNQLIKIEKLRTDDCGRIALTNKIVLMFWLWNSDPDFKELDKLMSDPSSAPTPDARAKINEALGVVKGLTTGLGLVPREILLRKRIQVLTNYYVNAAVQREVDLQKAEKLKRDSDPTLYERTIQAYYSAFHTLGNHTFDEDQIILDELIPGSAGEPTQLLALDDIKTGDFDAFFVDMQAVVPAPPDASQACIGTPALLPTPTFTIGVKKKPDLLTYYAIRLTAKAKLLFNPFGSSLKLKAYAAAQPFGSRIGPALTSDDFRDETPLGAGIPGVSLTTFIPNLPVLESDTTKVGWKRNDVINKMAQALSLGGGPHDAKIGWAEAERAFKVAMVPNPWEQGQYNIINDLAYDGFERYFESKSHYSFWAPLANPRSSSANDFKNELRNEITNVFKAPPSSPSGTTSLIAMDPKQLEKLGNDIAESLTGYIELLRNGGGEDGEGFHIASLANPFTENDGITPISSLTPDIFMNDPKLIRTSWNNVRDGSFQTYGRTGYSVKLVSFKTLMDKNTKVNYGGDTWDNTPPPIDNEADEDIPKLQH